MESNRVMNVLFLTLLDFDSLDEHNIYTDLLREFYKFGHSVYVVSPVERRRRQSTKVRKTESATILKLKIGNVQKTNIIEKGLSTVLIESRFIKGIRRFFSDVRFDMVLYSTPPITFYKAIEYVKKRDNARTYLMLKDIFPQNSVDLGMLNTNGWKGFIYRYFRNKEKKLYAISDRIGCMSPANMHYIIQHNANVNPDKVELCPNAIEVIDKSVDENTRFSIRKKYNIPIEKKVFVYGGNLGKPQGIPFLIECLKSQANNENVFFLIVGDGTEYHLLDEFVADVKQSNVCLLKRLPKEEYDTLVGACDIGMIFLDHRFTIPNFPSRLLSYMQAKLPVLAVTDSNTDIGKVIVEGMFGWWCESNCVDNFSDIINQIECCKDLNNYKTTAYEFLQNNYAVQRVLLSSSLANAM